MNKVGRCCPFALPKMADSSRRKIYEFLALKGQKTVGEITKRLKLKQPTISYHLKTMEEEGLLSVKKKGREVYYQVKMVCPEGGRCFSNSMAIRL
jgi:DNA-binding transcriptional ArsR family regulator